MSYILKIIGSIALTLVVLASLGLAYIYLFYCGVHHWFC